MAQVIVDKEAIFRETCFDFVLAEAEFKRLTAELKECKCDVAGKYERYDEDNCLSYHMILGFQTPAQDANAKNLCASCKRAMKIIEERVPVKKRAATAKTAIVRYARAKGKAAIAAQEALEEAA